MLIKDILEIFIHEETGEIRIYNTKSGNYHVMHREDDTPLAKFILHTVKQHTKNIQEAVDHMYQKGESQDVDN